MFKGIIQASVRVDEVAAVQPQKKSWSFSLLCLFTWPKSLDLRLTWDATEKHNRGLRTSAAYSSLKTLGRKLGVAYSRPEHEQQGQQYIKGTFVTLTIYTVKALKSMIWVKRLYVGSWGKETNLLGLNDDSCQHYSCAHVFTFIQVFLLCPLLMVECLA